MKKKINGRAHDYLCSMLEFHHHYFDVATMLLHQRSYHSSTSNVMIVQACVRQPEALKSWILGIKCFSLVPVKVLVVTVAIMPVPVIISGYIQVAQLLLS